MKKCNNCNCNKVGCGGDCDPATCFCRKKMKVLAKLELNPQDEVALYQDGKIYTTKQLIKEINDRTDVGDEFVRNYTLI